MGGMLAVRHLWNGGYTVAALRGVGIRVASRERSSVTAGVGTALSCLCWRRAAGLLLGNIAEPGAGFHRWTGTARSADWWALFQDGLLGLALLDSGDARCG